MSDNIQVTVRVRPFIRREEADSLNCSNWDLQDGITLVQVDPVSRRALSTPYMFDRVFGPESRNDDVYRAVAMPIVESALLGFNGTVFVYGQTSSGKTYTMMGDKKYPGIVPLAIQNIFRFIEDTPDREYLIRASYMEIYNENISDLLASRDMKGKSLNIREDQSGAVYVADLKEECANCEAKLLELMRKGEKNRHIGTTNMNERSSRSHTIFRIILESRERGDEEGVEEAVTVSHLNLVDLAGSENASQSGATGERLKEGGYINKSLFMLGRVISQLSEGDQFINFRDSKLTRILQLSLGGNAKTAIVCTVTSAAVEQTHSTLRFAGRAKSIKNKPVVNEILSDACLLKRYAKEIKALQETLAMERNSDKAQEVEQVREMLGAQARRNEELEVKIHELKTQLVVSSMPRNCNSRVLSKKRKTRRETWAAPAMVNNRRSLGTALHIGPLATEHKFVQPDLPPWTELSTCSEVSSSESSTPSPEKSISMEDFGNEDASFLFNQAEQLKLSKHGCFLSPYNNVNTKRRKRVKFDITPSPPAFTQEVGCQTEERLFAQKSFISSPFPVTAQVALAAPLTSPSTPKTPGTPTHILRFKNQELKLTLREKEEWLNEWKQELTELREYQRLEIKALEESFERRGQEKQAKHGMSEDQETVMAEQCKEISCLKQSLKDYEQLLMDANCALSNHMHNSVDLQNQLEELSEQNNHMLTLEEEVTKLRDENSHLKKDLELRVSRMEHLESERCDFDMMMELALKKQKQREEDLRRSLDDAWKEIAAYERGDKEEVQRRSQRVSELEDEVKLLTASQCSGQPSPADLQQQLEEAMRHQETTQREADDLRVELLEMSKLVENVKSPLEEDVVVGQRVNMMLKEEVEDLRGKLKQVVAEQLQLQALQEENLELRERLKKAEVEGSPLPSLPETMTGKDDTVPPQDISRVLSETLQLLEESVQAPPTPNRHSIGSFMESLTPCDLEVAKPLLEMLKPGLLALWDHLQSMEQQQQQHEQQGEMLVEAVDSTQHHLQVVAEIENEVSTWRTQDAFIGDYILHTVNLWHQSHRSSKIDTNGVCDTVKETRIQNRAESEAKIKEELKALEVKIQVNSPVEEDILSLPRCSPLDVLQRQEVTKPIHEDITQERTFFSTKSVPSYEEVQQLRSELELLTNENNELLKQVKELQDTISIDRRHRSPQGNRRPFKPLQKVNGSEISYLTVPQSLADELKQVEINITQEIKDSEFSAFTMPQSLADESQEAEMNLSKEYSHEKFQEAEELEISSSRYSGAPRSLANELHQDGMDMIMLNETFETSVMSFTPTHSISDTPRLRLQVCALQQENKHLQETIQQLQQRLKQLSESEGNKDRDVDREDSCISQLEGELQRMKEEKVNMEAEVRHLKEKLSHKNIIEEMDSLRWQRNSLKEGTSQLESDLLHIQKELNYKEATEEEMQSLHTHLETLEKEKSAQDYEVKPSQEKLNHKEVTEEKEEVQSLRLQVETLEKEKSNLNSEVKYLEEILNLKNNVEDVQNLQLQAGTLEKEKSELDSVVHNLLKVGSLKNEKLCLQSKVKHLEEDLNLEDNMEEVSSLQSQMGRLEKKSGLNSEMKHLKEHVKLKDCMEEASNLQSQVEKLEKEKSDLHSDVKHFQLEINSLEKEKSALDSQVRRLEEELNLKDYKEEMQDFQLQVQTLEKEKSNLVSELKHLEEQIKQHKGNLEEVQSLQLKVDSLEEEKSVLHSKMKCLEEKLDQKEAMVEEVQNLHLQMERLEEEKSCMETDIQYLQLKKVNLLEEERRNLNSEVKHLEEKLSFRDSVEEGQHLHLQVETLEKEKSVLYSEMKHCKEQVRHKDSMEEVQSLCSQVDTLEKEKSDLDSEIQYLQLKADSLDNEKLSLESEVKCLKKKMEDKEKSDSEAQHLQLKVESLENEKLSLESKIKFLQKKTENKTTTEEVVQRLQSQVETLEKEKSNLDCEIQHLQLKVDSLENEKLGFESDVKHLKKLNPKYNMEEVQSLQLQVETLQKEKSNLDSVVKHLEEEISCKNITEEDLHCLRWQVDTLKEEKIILETEVKYLQVEVSHKEKTDVDNQCLRLEVESLRKEKSGLDSEVKRLMEEVNYKDNVEELQSLCLQLETLKKEKSVLDYEVKHLKEQIKQKDNVEEVQSLQSQVETLEKEKSDLDSEIQHLQLETESLDSEKLSLESEVKCLKKKLDCKDTTEEVVQNLQSKVETLEKEKADLDSEVHHLQLEVKSLENENSLINSEVKSLEKKQYHKETIEEEEEEEVQSLQSLLETLEKEKSDLDSEVQHLQLKVISLENHKLSLESKVKCLEEEISCRNITEEDLHCLRWQVDTLKEEKMILETEVKYLQVEVSHKEKTDEDNQCLRLEVVSLRKEKSGLDSEIKRLMEEVNCKNNVEELQSLCLQLETLKKEKSVLDYEVKHLKEQIKQKDNMEEIQSLQSQVETLEKEKSDLYSEIQHLQLEDESLENKKVCLEPELKCLKKKLDCKDTTEEVVQNLQSQVETLEKEKANLNSEVHHLLLKVESQENKNSVLNSEVKCLEKKLDHKETIEEEVQSLQSQLETLQKEKSDLDPEVQHLQLKVNSLENDKLSLESELKCLKEEISCRNITEDLHCQVDTLKEEKVTLETEVKYLQEELSHKKTEEDIQCLKLEVESQRKEKSDLMKELNCKIQSLQLKIDSLENEKSSLEEEMQRRCESLKEEISCRNITEEDLHCQVDTLKEEKVTLETEVKYLQEELSHKEKTEEGIQCLRLEVESLRKEKSDLMKELNCKIQSLQLKIDSLENEKSSLEEEMQRRCEVFKGELESHRANAGRVKELMRELSATECKVVAFEAELDARMNESKREIMNLLQERNDVKVKLLQAEENCDKAKLALIDTQKMHTVSLDECDCLKAELRHIKEELSQAKLALETKEAETSQRISCLESEKQNMEAQITVSHHEIESLMDNNRSLIMEKERMKNLEAEHIAKISEDKRLIQNLHSELETKTAEITKQQDALLTLRKTMMKCKEEEVMSERCAVMEKEITVSRKSPTILRETVETDKEELEQHEDGSLVRRLQLVQRENKALQMRISEYQNASASDQKTNVNRINELKHHIHELETELQEHQRILIDIAPASMRDNQKVTKTSPSEECEGLKALVERLKAVARVRERQHEEKVQELVTQLNTQMNASGSSSMNASALSTSRQGRRKSRVMELEQEKESLQDELVEYSMKVKSLESALDSLRRNKGVISEDPELQRELTWMREKMEEAENKNKLLNRNYDLLELENQELQEALEKQRRSASNETSLGAGDKTEQLGEIDALKESNNVLQGKYQAMQIDCITEMKKHHTLKEKFEALQEKYDTLQEKYCTLQKEYSALQEEYSTISEQFKTLQEKYNTLQENYKTKEDKMKQTQSTRQETYSTLPRTEVRGTSVAEGDETRHLRDHLAAAERENNELRFRLRALNAPAMKEVEALTEELRVANAKVNHLKAELRRSQARSTVDTTIYEMTGRTSEPEHKERQEYDYSSGSSVVAQIQVLDLQNKVYHLEKEKKMIENERQVMDQHVEHYKRKAQEWKDKAGKLEKAGEEVKEQLVHLHTDLRQYRNEAEEARNCIERQQFELGHQRELIQRMEREQKLHLEAPSKPQQHSDSVSTSPRASNRRASPTASECAQGTEHSSGKETESSTTTTTTTAAAAAAAGPQKGGEKSTNLGHLLGMHNARLPSQTRMEKLPGVRPAQGGAPEKVPVRLNKENKDYSKYRLPPEARRKPNEDCKTQ